MSGQYHGEPATVWSLGIVLFALLCGDFPKTHDLEKIRSNTWTKDGLSKECCDIICGCLQLDPKQRIELKNLSLHDWFSVTGNQCCFQPPENHRSGEMYPDGNIQGCSGPQPRAV
ncbi:serine/threonine-protein kinase pim-1-like [Puntigrus tetrazona]|uniref:serine/threonine-protein kinase pim-1-like n=1 Tax=Puntigrus tetrazona TaxID=1606681 RepID=UPI001C8903E3|nr:serine/threonine-protein kinase pim-1-like [Puntigrus tetrazona]